MLYKNIKVDEVSLLVYLKSQTNASFEESEEAVFEWCQENGIESQIECPIIDDKTLEASVYIYLSDEKLENIRLLEKIYNKATREFKKATIALNLSKATKEGYNEIELTLNEFKELCTKNNY